MLNPELPDNWPAYAANGRWLRVQIHTQTLYLLEKDKVLDHWSISTALNGPGEQEGSGCTPRGWHTIRAKIGDGCPEDAVFVGRRWTQEQYSEALAARYPERDWILGRILWLSGLEPGFNRSGQVDTMRRYVYFHGTPPSEPMGIPLSHGCIRMTMSDIADFFDLIPAGIPVYID